MNEVRTLNALDTTQLHETVMAIKNQPAIAKFQLRAKGEWLGGAANRTTINDFYGAGQEHRRSSPFIYVSDEPPVLLGKNQGANPGEVMLQALAGCVTTTFILHATARGIQVKEILTTLQGDVDLQGALDLDKSVTPAFKEIRLKMDVKADCSDKEISDLIEFTTEHSTVFQSLSRPIPVKLERTSSTSAN